MISQNALTEAFTSKLFLPANYFLDDRFATMLWNTYEQKAFYLGWDRQTLIESLKENIIVAWDVRKEYRNLGGKGGERCNSLKSNLRRIYKHART